MHSSGQHANRPSSTWDPAWNHRYLGNINSDVMLSLIREWTSKNKRQYGVLNNPDAGNHIRPLYVNIDKKSTILHEQSSGWRFVYPAGFNRDVTPTFLKATKAKVRIRDSSASEIHWTSLLTVHCEVRSVEIPHWECPVKAERIWAMTSLTLWR